VTDHSRKYHGPQALSAAIGKISLLLVMLILAKGSSQQLTAKDFSFHHENVLGTSLELIVNAVSIEDAQLAEQEALAEIDRLNGIFSTYEANSTINRFIAAPAGTDRYLPPQFIELLVASDWWTRRTMGVFNPLAEEFLLIWKEHAKQDRMPEDSLLKKTAIQMSQPAWKFNPSYETVEKLRNAKFSLNAIAKGFIIDKASEAALNASIGVDSVLLSIGGDMRIQGSTLREVAVTDPAHPEDNAATLLTLQLQDQAVATSANYERGFSMQGRRFSHIIDPRTGYPVDGDVVSATVIAPSATQADALSTTLMILESAEAIQLIETLSETECLLVLQTGELKKSSGLDTYIKIDSLASAPAGIWQDEFELLLEFEINRPQERRRYLRPYVAVWIEDENGQAVKTLCLWMERGSSWVKKLSRWNRLPDKDPKLIRTLTRATRMPGRYKLRWDGTDDSGQALPHGKYTVFLEAVREHGTHGLIRKEVFLGTQHFQESVQGNVEISSAILIYNRKDS
jgi:thiamine biosynthesis lipoprotein